MKKSSNIVSFWGYLLVEELVRLGCEYFCISPGSRSTPLTVAIARNPAAKNIICFDERGAAFYALGYAKACGTPAVLVCTSGTALANYLPAVIEASLSQVPMIILSADRPPELRATGANQTIEQVGIFSSYVRYFFDLPCPSTQVPAAITLTTIDQALFRATNDPKGPVHINCMFREPLAPIKTPIPCEYIDATRRWQQSQKPFTQYLKSDVCCKISKDLVAIVESTQRGILVVGKLESKEHKQSVINLAKHLDWPLFADISSGLRFHDTAIHYFDQLLLTSAPPAQTIIHIGGTLVSKRWLIYLEKIPKLNYIVVASHPWRYDPLHKVTLRLQIDISLFCQELTVIKTKNSWKSYWQKKSQIVKENIATFVDENPDISEISIAYLVSKHVPVIYGLYLANSMPVRDMDMYGFAGRDIRDFLIPVAANRGASGIDGTIGSAIGFATALEKTVVLIIGDLAFLHDLNSLMLLKKIPQKLIIVLINNQGGGIFSFLPISQFKDVFEEYFATPHKLKFKNAAQMFALNHCAPSTNKGFIEAFKKAVAQKKSTIIEIATDKEENLKLHKKLQKQIATAMA